MGEEWVDSKMMLLLLKRAVMFFGAETAATLLCSMAAATNVTEKLGPASNKIGGGRYIIERHLPICQARALRSHGPLF